MDSGMEALGRTKKSLFQKKIIHRFIAVSVIATIALAVMSAEANGDCSIGKNAWLEDFSGCDRVLFYHAPMEGSSGAYLDGTQDVRNVDFACGSLYPSNFVISGNSSADQTNLTVQHLHATTDNKWFYVGGAPPSYTQDTSASVYLTDTSSDGTEILPTSFIITTSSPFSPSTQTKSTTLYFTANTKIDGTARISFGTDNTTFDISMVNNNAFAVNYLHALVTNANVNLGTHTLILSGNTYFSGSIYGAGNLTILSNGILNGTNTYDGNTTISECGSVTSFL